MSPSDIGAHVDDALGLVHHADDLLAKALASKSEKHARRLLSKARKHLALAMDGEMMPLLKKLRSGEASS
jgi:hypothetical protein